MVRSDGQSGLSWESRTDLGITHVKLEGRVDLAMLLHLVDVLYADPAYRPEFDGIIDVRGCRFELDFRGMMQYVNRIAHDPQRMTGNVVFVTDDKSGYGMTRMYSGLAPELQAELNIEDSVDAAIAWLKAQRTG